MFAPVSLLTGAPVAEGPDRAAASSLVVVVLPLVPVTSATRRPAARVASSPGSTSRPARPPATVPLPRPKDRDRRLTTVTAATAAEARAERVATAPSWVARTF